MFIYDQMNNEGMLQQPSHDSADQQFDQYVDHTYDANFVINGYEGGYSDGSFGNDPLIHSKSYQCPKFVNVHYVDSYMRQDGTVVNGHWRSNPDHATWNNLNANK
ncbi:hypothetical protein V7068_19185 [Bacillus sp. JJ634]